MLIQILKSKLYRRFWFWVIFNVFFDDIVKPRSSVEIIISGPDGDVCDEQGVADVFNAYFVKKIEDLKEKIDPNQKKDPLEKIKQRVKHKNLNFSLKNVTTETVKSDEKDGEEEK